MVVTKSVPVKDVNSSSKRPDVLQELGRITRTIVVHNTQKAVRTTPAVLPFALVSNAI